MSILYFNEHIILSVFAEICFCAGLLIKCTFPKVRICQIEWSKRWVLHSSVSVSVESTWVFLQKLQVIVDVLRLWTLPLVVAEWHLTCLHRWDIDQRILCAARWLAYPDWVWNCQYEIFFWGSYHPLWCTQSQEQMKSCMGDTRMRNQCHFEFDTVGSLVFLEIWSQCYFFRS